MPTAPRGDRLRRAARLLRPHRATVVLITSLTMLGGAVGALEPLLLKHLFDRLDLTSGPRALAAAVIGLTVLALVGQAGAALSGYLTWRIRLAIHHALLSDAVDHLHRLPVSYCREHGVGALMTRLDRGVQGVVAALTELTATVLPALVYLVIAATVMLSLDWRLAAVVLTFAPLPALISAWAAPAQTRRERDLLERWVAIYGRFHEVLSGLATVRSFAMEEVERHRFLGEVDAANREVVRGVGFDSRVAAAQQLAASLARIAALGAGGWLALDGRVAAGTLVAFLGYVGGLFAPVHGLAGAWKTLRTARVAMDAVMDVLDAEAGTLDPPGARAAGALRGEIAFEKVRFAYRGAAAPLLHGIDLRVAPGEKVALVGPSGAGKTTLVSLLQRFHDPCAGVVRVDGVDLRELEQRSVRRQIGVVLQDPLLFNDSVRNNIAYGRPEAADREIEAAARAANAHGFIERLPAGYRTMLGERGGRLSAGERQRLAIARALLVAPPILVLDEATSALDAETEHLVSEAVERLLEGRTALLIAHRLATVVRADRIVVLRDGYIDEVGTHRELMARDGYYASLVRRQTSGLLPDAV